MDSVSLDELIAKGRLTRARAAYRLGSCARAAGVENRGRLDPGELNRRARRAFTGLSRRPSVALVEAAGAVSKRRRSSTGCQPWRRRNPPPSSRAYPPPASRGGPGLARWRVFGAEVLAGTVHRPRRIDGPRWAAGASLSAGWLSEPDGQCLGGVEPDASAPANTSLLFDTAEWDALLDAKRELLRASNNPASTTVAIKQGMQKELESLNAARANGQRYPATGPELRNLTIAGERKDRVFITFINRFQRPFDRGPVDRYGASGFVVVAPYIFKFSIFSYVKSEGDLLLVVEREIDAL